MEEETNIVPNLIDIDDPTEELVDFGQTLPTRRFNEGSVIVPKAEVNVIDLSESLLEVFIKGSGKENVTGNDAEKTSTSLLIDISDEEKIPFPEALKFHAEVDDTFGLFTTDKKRVQSEPFGGLQSAPSHDQRHPYSVSTGNDLDEKEYAPLVFDDDFKSIKTDGSSSGNNDQDLPADVFASPPYIQPVASNGRGKEDDFENSGESDLLDIDNLSSFSCSDSDISFKASPKKSKFDYSAQRQHASDKKKELSMSAKEKIAVQVKEIFDTPSPSGRKTLYMAPKSTTNTTFKNYYPTPKINVIDEKSDSPDSPDSGSSIKNKYPLFTDYKTPTKYVSQLNSSSSKKTIIEPVRLTFSSSSESVEKKPSPPTVNSFQSKLSSFSLRSATTMIRNKFTGKASGGVATNVNKIQPMKANVPFPATATSANKTQQLPVKFQNQSWAHQGESGQFRPSSAPVERRQFSRQIPSSPRAPTTPNKTFDKFSTFSSPAKTRLSNVRSSGYGQQSTSFNTSLNVSRIPSSPIAQNKNMKAMTPTGRKSMTVTNLYHRRSLSQTDLSISSIPAPAYTSTLKRYKENKPAKPYKY